MASYIVWTCASGGSTATETLSTRQRPTCSAGQGAYVSIEQHPEFDVSQLNAADLGQAFGAGFSVVAMAVLVSLPLRIIVKAIRDMF